MPKITDRIPCNKYQGERVKLLENIIRLVKPDKKMMMAMIQPIIAVVVKGWIKRNKPIRVAIIPARNEKRFIMIPPISHLYHITFFTKKIVRACTDRFLGVFNILCNIL